MSQLSGEWIAIFIRLSKKTSFLKLKKPWNSWRKSQFRTFLKENSRISELWRSTLVRWVQEIKCSDNLLVFARTTARQLRNQCWFWSFRPLTSNDYILIFSLTKIQSISFGQQFLHLYFQTFTKSIPQEPHRLNLLPVMSIFSHYLFLDRAGGTSREVKVHSILSVLRR